MHYNKIYISTKYKFCNGIIYMTIKMVDVNKCNILTYAKAMTPKNIKKYARIFFFFSFKHYIICYNIYIILDKIDFFS